MVEFSSDFPFKRRSTDRVVPAPAADNKAPAPSPEPIVQAPVNPEPVVQPAPAPPKPFVERRKYMRERMAASGLIHLDSAKGPPVKVSLIDISIAGVRFTSPRPLDAGDKLQIRVQVGPFRWTTRMRVVHCTRTASADAIIGCAFLRTELLRPWPVAA
jgi:hypothetical protein